MSADAVQIQLHEHDRRLGSLHGRLGELSIGIGAHTSELVKLETKLDETRSDVEEIKEALENDRKERRAEGLQTRKALYTVAAFMATFSASIIGLIAALANHA